MIPRFLLFQKNRKGQSLIEILIALTIAVIIIGGVTTLIIVSMRSNVETKNIQISTSLAQDLIDSVKSIAEQDWHLIYDLNKGAGNNYHVSSTTNSIVSGAETILIENKPFSRYFYIENVRRSSCGTGNITTSATTTCNILDAGDLFVAEDPSTQKITVNISGEEGRTNAFIQYVSRTRNKAFVQTSWGGGSGQDNFSTTSQGAVINDKFSGSSGNLDFASQPGAIRLNLDYQGGGGVSFSDNFSMDLSHWTQSCGAWNIFFGMLDSTAPGNGDGVIFYATPPNTADQYAKAKFILPDEWASTPHLGIRFRGATGLGYSVDYNLSDANWRWMADWSCPPLVGGLPSGKGYADANRPISSGDTVSATVKGTEDSTAIKVWINTASNVPDAGGLTWDGRTPDISFSGSCYPFCSDSANKIGLYIVGGGYGGEYFDDFFGGDIP